METPEHDAQLDDPTEGEEEAADEDALLDDPADEAAGAPEAPTGP